MAFQCGRSAQDAQSAALDVTGSRRFAEREPGRGAGRDPRHVPGTPQRRREIVSWAVSRAAGCLSMSRHRVLGRGATA